MSTYNPIHRRGRAAGWILLGLGLGVGMLLSVPVAAQQLDDPQQGENITFNWLSWHDARDEARLQRKHILVFFVEPHCSDCRLLEKDTFADRFVRREVRENFIATRLDVRDFPALVEKYKVEVIPVTWFLDPDGRGLTFVRGFTPPDRMLEVMQYISAQAYETVTWKDWKKGIRPIEPETEQPGATAEER